MRIEGSPRIPLPAIAPAAASAPPEKLAAVRSPAVGPAVSFGNAVPLPEPTSNAGLARGAAFRSGHFERGDKMAPSAGLGLDPAVASGRDATVEHPLYGRYMRQWSASGGTAEPGQGLLSMLQQRFKELKDTMRGMR